jgi:dihydroorotate dehydrogenase
MPWFLTIYRLLYERAARPLLFRRSAQDAHVQMLRLLAWLDDHAWTHGCLQLIHRLAFPRKPLEVGGVRLPHPLILAAGFVKGEGFQTETEALQAPHNIIPGWRAMPLLVGAVEFGSYTRHPRLGNPGVVLWRDAATRSTQNRIGLKNPGARAAAAFMAKHIAALPRVYGINIAVSPGVNDPELECREVLEALSAFLDKGVRPAWFTLNLSCPNTEDDPGSHQTEARARNLCAAAVNAATPTPLWVKISPDLADEQYRALLRAFAETGVRAVVATNTLGAPAPDGITAGLGGDSLHPRALHAARLLSAEVAAHRYSIDIIACGGILDGKTYREFGTAAAQYMTALIYRGPLAAALIAHEGETYAP